MFKKLYDKIAERIARAECEIVKGIIPSVSFNDNFVQDLYDKVCWVSEQDSSKKHYMQTIENQQRTIEQLVGALKDKYEHGLFIFSEEGKIPKVIRNGKELTNDLTSEFKIVWREGRFPDIDIKQIAGTSYEMGK